MKKLVRFKSGVFTILFFTLLTAFIFRNYFLNNQVPFPSNLLVSLYEPWKSYSWKGYPSGPPNKPIGYDNLRIFYPLRKLSVDQIKQGEFPLWNPYNFAGNTLLATYQSAIFHPLSFLFFLLPQIDAWSVIIILQPIFASLFMYLLLRELKLSSKASFFGALTFAFAGFFIVWWEESFMSGYSALFLPLTIWSTEKLSKKITLIPFLSLVLSVAFSILSGWFQMSFYLLIFSFLWLFARNKKVNRHVTFIMVGFLIAFFLAGVHLIPSFEAYIYSARGSTNAQFLFKEYLQPLSHLISFAAPDLFGNPAAYNYFEQGSYHEKVLFIGIPAFFFALYSFFHKKNKFPNERFLKWIGIITLSLGFALPTSWLLYFLKIPFLSVMLPSRIFFLSTFCFSILASYGFERFIEKRDAKKITASLIVIFLLLTFGFLYLSIIRSFGEEGVKHFSVALKNLMLPSFSFLLFGGIVIASIKFKQFVNVFVYVIIVLSIGSVLYTTQKYLYFSDRNLVFPDVPVLSELKKLSGNDRFWSIGTGYIERNFATYYSLYSPEGYDSFYIKRYGELLYSALNNGNFTPDIQRVDAKIQFVDSFPNLQKDKFSQKLLSLLGVKYFVLKKDNAENAKTAETDFEKVWEDKIFIIYKWKKALPRTFLVNDFQVRKASKDILDIMYSDLTDLSKTILLEDTLVTHLDYSKAPGSAKILSYTPNVVKIQTNSPGNRILFLSDAYYPGWKVYIDGQQKEIMRADYAFRSVIVPKGMHTVEFVYKPLSFLIGIVLTLIGVIMLVIMSIFIKVKKT